MPLVITDAPYRRWKCTRVGRRLVLTETVGYRHIMKHIGAEFQAFTWCRDEASGIARAWREGREFGHDVAAVWAEAV